MEALRAIVRGGRALPFARVGAAARGVPDAGPPGHVGRRGWRGTVRALGGIPPASTAATNGEEGGGGVVGTVTAVHNGLAVLEGIRGDTPPGRVITFGGGGGGVLLAHREPQSFALLFRGTASCGHDGEGTGISTRAGRAPEVDGVNAVEVGERAVATESAFTLPAHALVRGRVVGCLGQPLPGWGEGTSSLCTQSPILSSEDGEGHAGDGDSAGTAAGSELLRVPPVLDEITAITAPLLTGVMAIDMLTPIGRGQCMLLSGEAGTGVTELAVAAVRAQLGNGTRCIYTAVGASAARIADVVTMLQGPCGELDPAITVVTVADPQGAGTHAAQRCAATLSAFAFAESARDAGEDVLLVLDDLGGLIGFTDDMMRLSAQPDIEHGSQEDSDRYDAMVVEATVSERRRFWGTALQRGGRLKSELGGGSITTLAVVLHPDGAYVRRPETEPFVAPKTVDTVAGFEKMSSEMQQKIRAALEAKAATAPPAPPTPAAVAGKDPAAAAAEAPFVQPRRTIEEFMSITDGQIIVAGFDADAGWRVSAKHSVSRIGTPGAAGPLTALNFPKLRRNLIKVEDMKAFGSTGAEKDKLASRSDAILGLFRQRGITAATLAEMTVGLFALQRGLLDGLPPAQAEAKATECVASVQRQAPDLIGAINADPQLKLNDEMLQRLGAALGLQ